MPSLRPTVVRNVLVMCRIAYAPARLCPSSARSGQPADADVEAALASIPGVAGSLALPEVVAALMELVKRAHMPGAARNVYLNPKRGDQALALTPAGAPPGAVARRPGQWPVARGSGPPSASFVTIRSAIRPCREE